MAYYVICGWLPLNFVVNFCVVTFLLVCDFWTVRELHCRRGRCSGCIAAASAALAQLHIHN